MTTAFGGSKVGFLRVGVVLTLALATGLAACGGSSGPTLTIGARETTEEEVLAQVYSQALGRAGFGVEEVVRLGPEPEDAEQTLKQGKVSGYPDHLSTPASASWNATPVSADPETAYQEARASLEEEGMTAFPPAPFSFTNLLTTLKATARKRGLKTFSDLRGQSEDMTVTGVPGCHQAMNCMEGLERLYPFTFGGFDTGTQFVPEAFEALETGRDALAFIPSTEGRLSDERARFTTLEEDKHLFPAGNAIFVTTPQIVEEAGPDFEATILAAQKGLTLPVMQRLDAKVEIEDKDPAKVASEYLNQVGSGT